MCGNPLVPFLESLRLGSAGQERVDEGPEIMQPVPQMSRNYLHFQLLDAWHAHYAHAFFLSTFVNVENKGSLNYIPKLKVASSILVARPKQSSNPLIMRGLQASDVRPLQTVGKLWGDFPLHCLWRRETH